jgi:hypothetical protein
MRVNVWSSHSSPFLHITAMAELCALVRSDCADLGAVVSNTTDLL